MGIVLPVIIGAVIGLSSGMFGIGGALLATPLLRVLLGVPEKLALATPLPAAIPAAISGSIAYMRADLVRFDIARRTLMTALPMTVLGAWVTKFVPGSALMVITGLVLIYSAWIFVRRGFGAPPLVEPNPSPQEHFSPTMYWLGASAGFASGFLAIGGGIVLVPAFLKVARLETKQALATSLLCVAALAIPGVVTHALESHIDWTLALLLSAGVIPMSYIGARFATSLRSATLEKIYGLAMLAFAIFFVIKNL